MIEKGTFLWKDHAEIVYQKLAPDPFLILLNNPKQLLHARNFLKIRYSERGLSKSFEKVKFIFSFEPGPL